MAQEPARIGVVKGAFEGELRDFSHIMKDGPGQEKVLIYSLVPRTEEQNQMHNGKSVLQETSRKT